MKSLIFIIGFLKFLAENISPIDGHCCHPCIIHRDFSKARSNMIFGNKEQEKGCSVDCYGKLSQDGACSADSQQVKTVVIFS